MAVRDVYRAFSDRIAGMRYTKTTLDNKKDPDQKLLRLILGSKTNWTIGLEVAGKWIYFSRFVDPEMYLVRCDDYFFSLVRIKKGDMFRLEITKDFLVIVRRKIVDIAADEAIGDFIHSVLSGAPQAKDSNDIKMFLACNE